MIKYSKPKPKKDMKKQRAMKKAKKFNKLLKGRGI